MRATEFVGFRGLTAQYGAPSRLQLLPMPASVFQRFIATTTQQLQQP